MAKKVDNDDPILIEIKQKNIKQGIRYIAQGIGALLFFSFILIRFQYAFQNSFHTQAAAGTLGIAIFLLLLGIIFIIIGIVLIVKNTKKGF